MRRLVRPLIVAAGLVAFTAPASAQIPPGPEPPPLIPLIATGPGAGGGPHVRLFNSDGSDAGTSFFAFDPSFRGGVSVTMGDLDGDGFDEIIAGAGPGGGPHVRVFDLDGNPTGTSFFPYDMAFRGGVNVGVADIDGDADHEIVTGAGAGGGPEVRVFDGDGRLLHKWFAYDSKFTGGVTVSGLWTDAEATAQDIVTGAGPGGGPHVRVFSPAGTPKAGFFAYDAAFRGGVNVARADVQGTGQDFVVTGAGPGGGPHVRIFSPGGRPYDKPGFFAYDPSFRGGVNVGSYLFDTEAFVDAIVTGAGPGGGPHVRGFRDDGTPTELNVFPYGTGFTGGVRVAGGIG